VHKEKQGNEMKLILTLLFVLQSPFALAEVKELTLSCQLTSVSGVGAVAYVVTYDDPPVLQIRFKTDNVDGNLATINENNIWWSETRDNQEWEFAIKRRTGQFAVVVKAANKSARGICVKARSRLF